ncbi:MAG: beta-phosphoglucomutase [Lutibacter sp.]|uniref:beta-phosphoglucomutase n=1 Tax=Lutibacter sp. TaxID=1925666 RepID=UPI001822FF4F|nr:beta-phosphoglucomutase [Lutibacter sp.]MBT8316590.1 beta-phosphoglucomutase [Lutibacter sp.]NNJ57450.1 beta-phosphoglucomutase [Lutibacter sp.]
MKKEIGFIFDLDGVIVDTAKYHYLAWRNLANSLGFDFTEVQNEQLKGVSRVKSLEILLDIGKVQLSQEKKEALLLEKNEEYLEYVYKMNSNEILPGVDRFLSFLETNKIKFVLGSASKNAQLILEKVGLLERFTAIVDGNNVSKAKPNPEVFLIGAKKLNMSPTNCVVVEDAIAGVQAANAANMISIGIGNAKVLSEANYVFDSMEAITSDFLKNLIN